MTYEGTVRGGVIVLTAGAQLPEGTAVTVHPHVLEFQDTAAYQLRNGVPVLPRRTVDEPITLEFVNQLRDEQP